MARQIIRAIPREEPSLFLSHFSPPSVIPDDDDDDEEDDEEDDEDEEDGLRAP